MTQKQLWRNTIALLDDMGITLNSFCEEYKITVKQFGMLAKNKAGEQTLAVVGKFIKNHKDKPKPIPKTLKKRGRKINLNPLPITLESLIAQELLVDPERAREYAKCKTVEDIYALRRQRWRDEGPPKHSSAHIDNADMFNLDV